MIAYYNIHYPAFSPLIHPKGSQALQLHMKLYLFLKEMLQISA